MKSPEFHELDAATQGPRRGILESTYDEPVFQGSKETYGDFPLARMRPNSLRVLRDRKKATPTAANQRIKVARAVLNWGLAQDPPLTQANPARDVPMLATSREGIHTWTVDEVRAYEKRHPVGTMARLALTIFLFTGTRLSDAIRLGRQHARDGWLNLRQFKGRNRHPVDIVIPILPELQEIIDATSGKGDLTFLATEYGRPFTRAGFGGKMRDWCDQAGLPQCSSHGLRNDCRRERRDRAPTHVDLWMADA